MTAKEYLKQAFIIDKSIKSKEKQLEWLKEHALYMTPQLKEKIDASPSYKSTMEEAAVKIMEIQNCIATQLKELAEKRMQIVEVIRAVNNPEYETVLEMRYLAFMSWEDIATRMDYGLRYIYKVHGRALELVRIPA